MTKYLFISILSFLSLALSAQLETDADFRRQVYEKEMSGGISLNTRGYSLNLRHMKFADGYNKIGWEIDMAILRHPKEVKFQNQLNFNSARSFVYGKLNGFYTIRAGFGRDKVLVDKTDKGTVSISWITMGGPSFGILKPIYLEVVKENDQGINFISTERYDPAIHNYVDIYGQAQFFTGIEKSSLRMGLYAKTGFAFDFNISDKKVTTIETGAVVDYFPSWGIYGSEQVPIMYQTENYSFWWQLYVSINFGGKWN